MGANTCYWQIRFENDERTMVAYRDRDRDPEPDLADKTVRFRDLEPPRPECLLFGVQFQGGMTPAGRGPRDYELTEACAGHPWLDATGLEHPATLPGLVGYEWDALAAGIEPANATTFFHYDCPDLSPADAVLHRSDSGALVFAAGSLQFAWGLDDWDQAGHADDRLQRLMRNALADLTVDQSTVAPRTRARSG
jgi:hypothetical protein